MKVLVFDVFGDFGHFKKFYTTSSPLTFSFPPPPTVKGMLGAIIGADKSEYLNVFSSNNCKIAIRILLPVKKIRMGMNHINTKGNYWIPVKKKNHEARTQIRTEFLKNPAYRIYVYHNDRSIFDKLSEYVMMHKTVYTLSMGLSELLADFKYVGVWEAEEHHMGECEIVSVIPMNVVREYGIRFEEGKRYFKEKMAVDMKQDRIVERYEDVLFEAQGKSICAQTKVYWEVENGERIVFF
ncbi:CRISPR-associated protein Cas5h [Caldicoprobacter guelmensis]|uniref:type I-B CRISPR-associated protein Cas5b n=1 Tax=Caldicoprobacter guelmensis TaxID=1170224 RepID=UPI0019560C57|nr:type I-B CRISPR-associated protein Cas5b [Caldicoprobacter guelmensis]MBM7582843.1 CRISPR-associated protein Cas5h [Caldicoprobacter guelmensis]